MPSSDLPASADKLKSAAVVLVASALLTMAPLVFITGDHIARQRTKRDHQATVFALLGLSSPSLFPSGHPIRNRAAADSPVDWRPAPLLPRAAPGPIDLVRPREAAWSASGHDR
jgi:hypothetical protein